MTFMSWLEAHENLAGWAQFFGAMLALVVTYFTAFAPVWRRKRQLQMAGQRLLSHGFETLESYHRTSANFLPLPISVQFAAMTMRNVVEEMNRFPIYELDNHGSNSLARRIVSMSMTLSGMDLFLQNLMAEVGDRALTEEEHEMMRTFLAERMELAGALVLGLKLKRPEWPGAEPPPQPGA